VAIHRGQKKPVREHVRERRYTIGRNETVAEPVMKNPDRREKIRRTKATKWASNTSHKVWAHVGTTRGDIYSIWMSKENAEAAAKRNPAFPGKVMRGSLVIF
jgi:hypothetical protein